MIGPIDRPREFTFLPVLAETLIAFSEVNEPYIRPLNVTRSRLTTTENLQNRVFGAIHEGRYRFGVHCGHDAILATRVVPFDSSKYEAFLLQDPRAGFFNESERVPRVGRYTGIGAHNSRLADKLFAPAL